MRNFACAILCLTIVVVAPAASGEPCMAGTPQRPERGGQRLPRTEMDLGISVAAADQGIRIANVRPGGPADLAGLRAGDVLLEQDGRSLAAMFPPDFLRNVADVPLGGVVTFKVLRQGSTFTRKAVNGVGLPDLARRTTEANAALDAASAAPSSPTPPASSGQQPAPEPAVPMPAAPTPPAPAQQQAPTRLTITRLTLRPASVPSGSRFTMEVGYSAPPGSRVGFVLSISADGRELFTSDPETVQGGSATSSGFTRSLGTSSPGTYRVRVRLTLGDEAAERVATLTVTTPPAGPH